MGHMLRCERCGEQMPASALVDHLRTRHPQDVEEGVVTWPDGGPVVVDQTLTPDDFCG